MKKITARHITIKLPNITIKEELLKAARENVTACTEEQNKMTADFFWKHCE